MKSANSNLDPRKPGNSNNLPKPPNLPSASDIIKAEPPVAPPPVNSNIPKMNPAINNNKPALPSNTISVNNVSQPKPIPDKPINSNLTPTQQKIHEVVKTTNHKLHKVIDSKIGSALTSKVVKTSTSELGKVAGNIIGAQLGIDPGVTSLTGEITGRVIGSKLSPAQGIASLSGKSAVISSVEKLVPIVTKVSTVTAIGDIAGRVNNQLDKYQDKIRVPSLESNHPVNAAITVVVKAAQAGIINALATTGEMVHDTVVATLTNIQKIPKTGYETVDNAVKTVVNYVESNKNGNIWNDFLVQFAADGLTLPIRPVLGALHGYYEGEKAFEKYVYNTIEAVKTLKEGLTNKAINQQAEKQLSAERKFNERNSNTIIPTPKPNIVATHIPYYPGIHHGSYSYLPYYSYNHNSFIRNTVYSWEISSAIRCALLSTFSQSESSI